MDNYAKTKKEYQYYDGTHKTYIEVSKDLQPILKKMDRRTRYIEYDQYYHNEVFLISDLSFVHEKYNNYSDKGIDGVLHRLCAHRMWEDIGKVLSTEELLFLKAAYFGKLDNNKTPLYKMSDYNRQKCKKEGY